MCERLSDEQISELYGSFLLLDGDGDGRIDAADFQNFLQTFGYPFSLAEVEEWINEEAVQPAGVLDFPEFVNMLNRLVAYSSNISPDIDDENLQQVFDLWDSDGDGKLTCNDLRRIIEEFGEVWTDEQINDMIYAKKSDGHFTIKDLREVLIGRQYIDRSAAK